MADQGIWFKLYCSAIDDPDLDNLDISDFGRWCKLGAFIKRHGTDGELTITPPARALCAMFQVADFEQLIDRFNVLPHINLRRAECSVAGETNATVSFANWMKYQGDLSTQRVRKYRQMKRSRGEEKRGEEKREEERGEKDAHAKKTQRTFPEGFTLTDELRAKAIKKGCKNPEAEFENFENWTKAKGRKYIDWPRAFMSHVARELEKREDASGQASLPAYVQRRF